MSAIRDALRTTRYPAATLEAFGRPAGWGPCVGLARDDSTLVVRDLGIHEIYALDFQTP